MKTMLVVEDQVDVVNGYRRVFEHEGFRVLSADTEGGVMKLAAAGKPDIVLLDIDLKGDRKDRSGVLILEKLRQRWSKAELPIFIVSGAGDTALLAEVKKKGADEYVVQPVDDYRGFLKMVNQYLEKTANTSASPAMAENVWQEQLTGKSRLIMNLFGAILRAAEADCDTLILGETGTGKDLIAKIYHQNSRRAKKPFFMVNCPAIAQSLGETELFGYAGRAFTDADPEGREGKIEVADGGVVFFNEIGDLSLAHQAMLLNFIQNKVVSRVGSTRERKLDVVVLAATNRNLATMVEQGTFRKDLYYRIFCNVLISPPLRDRLEDIPLLCQHFLRRSNHALQKQVTAIDPRILAHFQTMNWDGNVRQLEKCIHVGVLNCQGTSMQWEDIADFITRDAAVTSSGAGAPLPVAWEMNYQEFVHYLEDMVRKVEISYYTQQLERNGNVSRMAEAIAIKNRTQLYQILKRLNIKIREQEDDAAGQPTSG